MSGVALFIGEILLLMNASIVNGLIAFVFDVSVTYVLLVFLFLKLFILSCFDLSASVDDQFCRLFGTCRYEIFSGH